MIERLLIANRGEIVIRVVRTARRLGIETVAVHTDADRSGPHVRAADTALHVDSYLDGQQILDVARETGATAVHPGYGFLSENAAFARAVIDAGLVWVGPPPEAMEAMARKDHAREIAVAAGVPVVPSWSVGVGGDAGLDTLAGARSSTSEAAGDVSFPVLVKAAAGGGGKGMRVVRSAAELEAAKAAAAREAASAFGDDTLLIEKYVERGRHIEVQVFGDSHGGVVHFGTRDCSAQRRHQKVVEEAPAPTLTDDQRALVQDSAVALAKQVGYANAGTVEFLLDEASGEAYFLEMNTRLQVEHPVTEETILVRGRRLDLVELQLRVAAGEPLGLTQDEVGTDGHSIEVRVYAEDAYHGYLPQAGRATVVEWPRAFGVRVDHALESGQVVSTSYDPMLGKVIVRAGDREAARRGLIAALDETVILGITTNTGFLRQLLATDLFEQAAIHTAWLDANPLAAPDASAARRAAAWAWYRHQQQVGGPFASDGFRLGGPAAPLTIELDELVELEGPPPQPTPAVVSPHGVELADRGQRFVFTRPDPAAAHETVSDGTVASPMPGTVLDVRVAEGDAVEEGQVLGVVEAMKMELALKAPYAGTVTRVGASVGAQVALGALLFEVAASEHPATEHSATEQAATEVAGDE
ncbi:biotin carboxylase N-terminal domain-containing protein [Nocardioides sp. AN3]